MGNILRSTFSNAFLLVCGNRVFLMVRTLFLTPGQDPLSMMKSFLTEPYLTKPPIGVIDLLETSYSVEPLCGFDPKPTR